ncbi:MAG TPA: hypothetical protein VGR32_08670 [Brevundimonas sp.]|jgi:hypothetical protein|uniref:hypothetical protein n=1 Tax=Brevundimonas sp. TaxID=1871086 RepID=UPI002DF37064|nr:hypothetical protein [Brevundimonas sp.]
MNHAGFKWSLRPEGDRWRWAALGRDEGIVVAEGFAKSRAEGAACLARFMSQSVLGDQAVWSR